MAGKGIIHTDEVKIKCGYLYASSGNYSQVARDTHINRTSIMSFAKSSDVFNEAVIKARQEISDELLAQNLAIALAANEQVADRVKNGDSKWIGGVLVKQPMSGRDLAVVSGIKEDKARVSLGLVTSVTGTSKTMKNMIERFERIERDYQAGRSRVVSVQEQ